MTLTSADVVTPVAHYARRFHAVAGSGHHVGSPLGAWLLLALCAPPSEGTTRQTLNGVLGCDVADAAGLAAGLLASPDPQVPAAAAVWHRPGQLTDVVTRWLAGLPPQVQTGPLTSQADLDDWARRGTLGLIERFPVALDPSLYLLAATVLAARVSWERPFDLAPASALGPSSPWTGMGQVLRTPDGPGHEQFVAATQGAGDVAVHAARARGGLQVISVAAAPGIPAADVLAAAYDLGPALASGAPVARRSLFDLPLGEGPLWAITERTGPVKSASGREERCTAVLPAWSASSQQDLSDPSLGFAAAAQALAPGDPWQARQAAMARYSRVGFEAGAVTGLAIAMAARPSRPGLIRAAELRFGHPYAVVAVAAGDGLWHGLPVFSAWVAQPEDAGPGN
jgi:hypothetical protein